MDAIALDDLSVGSVQMTTPQTTTIAPGGSTPAPENISNYLYCFFIYKQVSTLPYFITQLFCHL